VSCSPVDWGGQTFQSGCGGHLSLRQAFASSSNTAALRLARRIGLESVVAKAHELGISTPLEPVPGLVLGQAAVTVNQTVASLCRWRRSWIPPWGLDLQGWLIDALIGLLRIEITPWDLFSIRQRHFIHEPITNPERFGLVSTAPTLEAVFETAGLPRRGAFQPNVSKLRANSPKAQAGP